MPTFLARVLVTLLLGASLSACGSDQPAVCGSADTLESSIADLKDVDVKADGLSALQSQLATVKEEFVTAKAARG